MHLDKYLKERGYTHSLASWPEWWVDPTQNIAFEVGEFAGNPCHLFHFERIGKERGHGVKVLRDLLEYHEPITACTLGIEYYKKYFHVEGAGFFVKIYRFAKGG